MYRENEEKTQTNSEKNTRQRVRGSERIGILLFT